MADHDLVNRLSASTTGAVPPRFLVCPPDHFDTHFLFNPFMSYRERVSPRRARSQWRTLVHTLEEAGAAVERMEPSPSSSALPFTADGAYCYAPGRTLVLRNDGPRGELEPSLFSAWFQDNGYEVESLPPGCHLEGGNLLRLPTGDVLVGLKAGGVTRGERYFARLLALVTSARTWSLALPHRRHLHLDTVVGVLGRRGLLVYREGLQGELPADGPAAEVEVIEVGHDDARRFACNLVVVGDVVITGSISKQLSRRISSLGYRVERLRLDEFHKAGGGAKCLTLPVWPREEQSGVEGGSR